MEISELLSENRILLKQKFKTKKEVFNALIDLHMKYGFVSDRKEFERAIWNRENEVSTAIENGVVIPHAKTAAVKQASLAVVTLENPIDCSAYDKKFSSLFVMIAVPDNASNEHLKILQKLVTLFIYQDLLDELKATTDPKKFIYLINNYKKRRIN